MDAPRYQFGLGRLVALTTVSALAFVVASWLAPSSVGRAVLGTYFCLLAGYLVLREAHFRRRQRWYQARMGIDQQREEALAAARIKKSHPPVEGEISGVAEKLPGKDSNLE